MHELDDLLFADEKVLWRGAPEPGIHLHKEELLIIPFSILWSGFAFFWELSVLAKNAPLLFQLWGIPFVLAGLYMLIGRFFASAWQARRTSYAVTDRRILMVSRSRHNEIPLNRISHLELQRHRGGLGSILLETGRVNFRLQNRFTPDYLGSIRSIRDSEQVYRLISESINSPQP